MTNEDYLLKIKMLEAQNQELQDRLEETEEALRAISTGEVDALVVYGNDGERIYTLQGADYAYRVMVESIHEGAANIKADGTILYANKRLAEMLKTPLENVLGSPFYHYLSPDEQKGFTELVVKGLESFGRAEFNLSSGKGAVIPVLITMSAAEVDGRRGVCLVVTDLTEQKQVMARERELQVRLMEQREDERIRIARNLHDGPLQDLLGLSYTLQAMLTTSHEAGAQEAARKKDILAIRESILELAGVLRTVCNELRPPHIIRFGLAKAIRYQSEELQGKYQDLAFHLDLDEDGQSVPKEISTVLFRIYQECMNNVIRHAEATDVTIRLLLDKQSILLEIEDNGKGFKLPDDWVELARQGHLGLVGMRERAEAAGGKIRIKTDACCGTTVQVKVPIRHNDPQTHGSE